MTAAASSLSADTAFVVKIMPLGTEAFAIALADGRVQLAEAGETLTVRPHLDGLLSACGTVDGDAVITGGEDGRIVSVQKDGSFETLHEAKGKWIDRIATGPEAAIAFSSGRDAVLLRGKETPRQFRHDRSVNGLAFAPKGYRLAAAHVGGVSLWWAGREAEPTRFHWEGAHIDCLFSPDGKYIMTSMTDNQLHGWRLSDGQNLRMAGYPTKVRSISWTTKGEFMATSGGQAAILWPFKGKNGPIGQQPTQLGGREALVTQIACHPKFPFVAIGHQDGYVHICEIEGNRTVEMRPADGDPVSALGFNRSGNLLALGTEGGYVGVHALG